MKLLALAPRHRLHREHIIDRLWPDMGPEAEETKAQVEKALGLINPRYAEALRLRLLEDEDRDACAEKMGVTIGNFD